MFTHERSTRRDDIPKFRFRWIVYMLTGFTLFTTTSVSSSLGLTIVAMIKDSNSSSITTSAYAIETKDLIISEQVNWSNVEKDRMLQAISWGSLVVAILGGRLAELVGPRLVNFFSLVLIGSLNCIYPAVAVKSYAGAYAIRVIQGFSIGVTGPTNYVMLTHWAPFFERTSSNAIVNAFSFASNAIINPIVGVLVTSSFIGGWPSVFYILGVTNLILAIVWLLMVRDKPEDHPWLHPYEINEITLTRSKRQSFPSKLPWLSMLSSIPVLAYLFNGFTHGWLIAFVTSQVPSFYQSVFNVNFKKNGIFSSLPWILNIIVVLFAGYSADRLRRSERFNLTRLRKGYTLIGLGISTITILGITFIGNNMNAAVALLTLTKGIGGLNLGGSGSNQLDLSPSFAGTLSGIQATVTSLSQLAMNEAIIWTVGNSESQAHWYTFFYITSGISLLGVIVFCLFGSGEIQKFDPCSLHSLIPRYSQDSSHQSWEITGDYFVETFS